MEDFISAISDLLKKWMGDNGWRFWLCSSIVLSVMWDVERNNYWGYGALFALLMTILLLIGYLCDYKKDRRRKKINRLVAQCNADDRKKEEESRNFENKNRIWKVFAVANEDAINAAITILSLREIEKNPLVRFASQEDISKNHSLWGDIVKARETFVTENGYGTRYEMIYPERTHLGYYIKFDQYLFTLLVHYRDSHERKFI